MDLTPVLKPQYRIRAWLSEAWRLYKRRFLVLTALTVVGFALGIAVVILAGQFWDRPEPGGPWRISYMPCNRMVTGSPHEWMRYAEADLAL